RDGLQPSASRGTRADFFKTLKGAHENRLGDVFRLCRAAHETHGGRKHHVLISPDECFEQVGVGHAKAITRRPSLGQEPGTGRKVSETGTLPINDGGSEGKVQKRRARRSSTGPSRILNSEFRILNYSLLLDGGIHVASRQRILRWAEAQIVHMIWNR